jgi:hypothetical protein
MSPLFCLRAWFGPRALVLRESGGGEDRSRPSTGFRFEEPTGGYRRLTFMMSDEPHLDPCW